MPYRTPPKKDVSWGDRFNSLVASLKELTKPKCQRPEGACTFRAAEQVRPSWNRGEQHDVLYYDEPIAGRKNGGFYWAKLVPHRFECKHCKRAFRIGDPLPEGASLDHWQWSPGVRKKPSYLTDGEWAALVESNYFGM